jgi:glycyl-tRNA synthetase
VAPVEIYVFPLVNKNELNDVAQKIQYHLRERNIITEYDISGTIGRRYARSDEIGVPFAITIDYKTLEDNSVTVRNRDDQKQIRVALSDLYLTMEKLLKSKLKFEEMNVLN